MGLKSFAPLLGSVTATCQPSLSMASAQVTDTELLPEPVVPDARRCGVFDTSHMAGEPSSLSPNGTRRGCDGSNWLQSERSLSGSGSRSASSRPKRPGASTSNGFM